jgi:putative endonuclease
MRNVCPEKVKQGWSLYVLECSDGTLYTGITNDLARRVAQHNNGTASRYTRCRTPVKLVHEEPCKDRSQALKRESAMKRLTRSEKIASIRGGRR